MKKEAKTKKMTIDKLAIMVAKGFENTATKDDIKNLETKLEKKIEGLDDRLKGTDKRIDDFAETKVSKVVYKELEHRVGLIEKNLK